MCNPEDEQIEYDGGFVEDTLKHLAYHRAELEKAHDHANNETDKIKVWRHNKISPILDRIEFHEANLRTQIALSGKKSLKMIHGTISTRVGTEKVVFVETDGETPDAKRTLFTQWALISKPELVEEQVTQKIDARKVLKAIKEHGELFPGCAIEVGASSFKVEVNK